MQPSALLNRQDVYSKTKALQHIVYDKKIFPGRDRVRLPLYFQCRVVHKNVYNLVVLTY